MAKQVYLHTEVPNTYLGWEPEQWAIFPGNCSPPGFGRPQCAASTETPAMQVRMAAKAVLPRSIPVSMTEQMAA